MRRRPTSNMPSEPDYSPVPGEEIDGYDLEGAGSSTAMPSSFYSMKKNRPRSFLPRTFNCRRRLVVSMFVFAVVAAAFYLGVHRGHIKTGEFAYGTKRLPLLSRVLFVSSLRSVDVSTLFWRLGCLLLVPCWFQLPFSCHSWILVLVACSAAWCQNQAFVMVNSILQVVAFALLVLRVPLINL